jgi:RNA polymerase sigma factor (sigma-70 family)
MDKELRYEAVIEENKDRIYRICCCYVRDSDERNDVYQEVLIHLWQGLDSFAGKSQVSTWVYRVAVNTCFGFLRSEQRRKKLIEPAGARAEELLLNHPAEANNARVEREIEQLYECISDLPLMDKTLVSLYLEDLSTKEMSDVLDISEANVRVKLHRIKKSMKEAIERKSHGLG